MMNQIKRPPARRPANARAMAHIAIALAGLAVIVLARPASAEGRAPALHDAAALLAEVEAFAGARPGVQARLDPRLVVPYCPATALAWARADVVRVDCAAPAWTLYVPITAAVNGAASRPPGRPAIRRGEKLVVEAAGPGFTVTMAGEAERDADGARVTVKSPAGRRFTARIADDGRLVLDR
jgi:hypothetical protein